MTAERHRPQPALAEYAARREAVFGALQRAVLVVSAGHLTTYAHDCDNRFRPDGNFRYLTGFPEPDAIAVLRPDAPHPFTLFVPPRDPQQETWTGRRLGPEGATSQHGADAAFPLDLLDEQLPALLDGTERLYYGIWRDARLDTSIAQALRALRGKERFGRIAPATISDPGLLLHDLRLIKRPAEIEILTTACQITAAGHRAGMGRCRPGATEYQVQAEVERTFRERGAAGPGFATIAASGDNGSVLHYTENDAVLRAGDLLLLDAGAEFGGYNGDITRTFPVSGRFTPAQRALYQIVETALEQGIAAAKPGATIDAIHEQTLRILANGLIDLKVLHAPLDEILERELYKPYYMHRTSHWLGIDVHDVGRYRVDGTSRPLSAGMVITVEPGLYLPQADTSLPEELRGQSVRIEDDVLITSDGCRVLTRDVPVDAEAVGALVGR